MKYSLVACGGTFDRFHKGHESLLKLAFSLGVKVIVGVTSDEYVKKLKIKNKKLKIVEDFERRKQEVLEFAEKEKVFNRVEIVKIDDLFGPTLDKNLSIDAIVVSEDSKKGAEIINQKRRELRLKALSILVAPSVYAEDGSLISSARIRNGEINRMGRLYVNPLWLKRDLILPENLREELKKPFGEIVQDIKRNGNFCVIAVGDVTAKKFNENYINQDISAVDFRIAREEKFTSFSELGFSGDEKVITADNPAGSITCDLFSKVLDIFKSDFDKRIILKIAGEEDLAVLPLILGAPLATIIYYGQPNAGLVKVVVSEASKDKAYGLVSKFKLIEIHTRGY